MLFKKLVDTYRDLPQNARTIFYIFFILPLYAAVLLLAALVDLFFPRGAGAVLAMLACLYFSTFALAVETNLYDDLWPEGQPVRTPLMLTVLFFEVVVQTLRSDVVSYFQKKDNSTN